MTRNIKTDICVIGAGSAGLSVAAGAVQLGKSVVLIEKGKMGGDCLNYGCVPSKALIAAGRTAQEMREAARFGIGAVEPQVDYKAVLSHVHRAIAEIEPNDSQERFEKLGCTVLREAARFTGPREVTAGDTVIKAKHIVVATGSSPFVPPIEGLDGVPHHTNETIFYDEDQPRHLLIIGGGPIGCEMAQAHRRLGAEVTLIETASILPKDDPELVAIARAHLQREGVTVIEGAKVTRASGAAGDITLSLENGGGGESVPHSVTGTHLLVATGRRANVDGLDLDKAGVEYNERGVKADKHLRTSNSRVWAAGDVAGGRQFTHVAGYHASVLVQNMLFKLPGKNKEYNAPWVTYMDPELAHVGLTEAAAKDRGETHTVARWSLEENDRAHAEHATSGMAKIVVGKGGKVLGASIIGRHAGDLIGPWALVIANGIKIKAFTNMIAPYPTLGEISKRAAGAYYTPTLFSPRTRLLIRLLSVFD